MTKPKTTRSPAKARNYIPMGECVTSFVDAKCKKVPGALVPLSEFRKHTRDYTKSNLVRTYRWRRDFSDFPTGVRVTRRSVCKVCKCVRPTKETCTDHYDPATSIGKASFVCGVVISDEPYVSDVLDNLDEWPTIKKEEDASNTMVVSSDEEKVLK